VPEAAQQLTGIGASPGIAIGRAFLLDRRRVKTPKMHIAPEAIEVEIARLDAAIKQSYEQLEGIKQRLREAHGEVIEGGDRVILRPVEAWGRGRQRGRRLERFERLREALSLLTPDHRRVSDFLGSSPFRQSALIGVHPWLTFAFRPKFRFDASTNPV